MIIWLDAQLPPSAAAWIPATFGIEARAVRDLGLRDAKDPPIFQAARAFGRRGKFGRDRGRFIAEADCSEREK